jgi:hypothetical protein
MELGMSSFRSPMFRVLGALAIALLLFMNAESGSAQQPAPRLNAAAFSANPGQVLQQNPNGGPELAAQIRDLAVADPVLLDKIMGLLETANKSQKSAIGSGLSQAAKIVVATNQAYATQIQEAIAKTKDEDVVFAFTSDVATGAAAGGAASGGASGGQTNAIGANGGGGSLAGIGGPGTATMSFSVNSSVTSGSVGQSTSP